MTYLFLMMKSMGMVTESHPQATAIRNEKAGQVGNISYNPFLHINPIRICAGTCHFGIPLWTAWPTDDNVPLPHNQYQPMCGWIKANVEGAVGQKVKVNHSTRFSLITKMIWPSGSAASGFRRKLLGGITSHMCGWCCAAIRRKEISRIAPVAAFRLGP